MLGSRTSLDITAGPGSSGSPVFDPVSGEVSGIIVSGKEKKILSPGDNIDDVKVEKISSGIAEADPILQVKWWIEEKFANPSNH